MSAKWSQASGIQHNANVFLIMFLFRCAVTRLKIVFHRLYSLTTHRHSKIHCLLLCPELRARVDSHLLSAFLFFPISFLCQSILLVHRCDVRAPAICRNILTRFHNLCFQLDSFSLSGGNSEKTSIWQEAFSVRSFTRSSSPHKHFPFNGCSFFLVVKLLQLQNVRLFAAHRLQTSHPPENSQHLFAHFALIFEGIFWRQPDEWEKTDNGNANSMA